MDGNTGHKQFCCCNKTFASEKNMMIHQAKKCRRKGTSQQRRSSDRQTSGSTHQESNHSMSRTAAGTEEAQTGVAERKPKINWPKGSEAVKYKQFDATMSEVVSRLRGKPEWKLERSWREEGKEGWWRKERRPVEKGEEDGGAEKGEEEAEKAMA
jgi:hypothetical protein